MSREEKKEKGGLSLDEALKVINKECGAGTARTADQNPDIQRVPIGIFSLDHATGGGFPMGRVVEIYGAKSSGKTTVCLKLVKAAQAMCRKCVLPQGECQCKKFEPMNCVWLDMEGVFDRNWSAAMGVDNSRLQLIQPEYMEQITDIFDLLIRTGEVGMIILDSVAQAPVKEELEKSAEEATVGKWAKAFNLAFRKWSSSMAEQRKIFRAPMLVIINQPRKSMAMYGDPETLPGGMGQEFASSLMLRFSTGTYYYENDKKEAPYDGAKPLYQEISFVVKKSKIYLPRIEGTYTLYLGNNGIKKLGDTDDDFLCWKYAKQFGIVRKEDGKWKVFDDEGASEEEMMEKYIRDPKRYPKFRKKVLETLVS